jgi:precorrin-6B methylase 2
LREKEKRVEKVTDWAQLWRELTQARAKGANGQEGTAPPLAPDAWRDKARSYYEGVQRRWARPDSSRTFVVNWLDAHPGCTALDIGAGPGAWTVLMARHAREVTAVEPSPAMIEVLKENAAEAGLNNVRVVQAPWPAADVARHDISLCFHAMYGSADLPAFLQRMMTVTRRTCFLGLRAPTHDGLMAQIARRVRGHDYDSANFQVAYNVLLQMGICANVQMEDSGLWEPWTSPTLEDALSDVKRRFGMGESCEHDEWLTGLLRDNLTLRDGHYVWPRGVRSALVYWDVAGEGL